MYISIRSLHGLTLVLRFEHIWTIAGPGYPMPPLGSTWPLDESEVHQLQRQVVVVVLALPRSTRANFCTSWITRIHQNSELTEFEVQDSSLLSVANNSELAMISDRASKQKPAARQFSRQAPMAAWVSMSFQLANEQILHPKWKT